MQGGRNSLTIGHLLAIPVCWNLAVAQPLYDVLSHGAEFFVFKHVGGIELITLVFTISIAIPFLLAAAVYYAEKIFPIVGKSLFIAMLTLFFVLFILPLYREASISPLLLMAGAIACSGGLTAGYFRFKNLRTFFLFLTPAILLIPALFLCQTQIRKLIQFKEPVLPHLKVSSKTPIVLIVFDEFPVVSLLNKDGFLDEKAYPNIARLLSQADWYRNATTSASTTSVAVPGILTGSKPDAKRLPTVRDYPRNLFTLLADSYDIQAIEMFSLRPEKMSSASGENSILRFNSLLSDILIVYLNIAVPSDWRVGLPSVSVNWVNFSQQAEITKRRGFNKSRNEMFQLFLDSIHPSEEPGLYFLHSQLPHSPWQYLPSGKEYSASALDGMFVRSERWTTEESASLCAQQRHMLQVSYTDHLVGRLITRLNDLKMFDDTLIIITSDHGVSFRPGDARRNITRTNYADIICVPMIIKKPYQKTGRVLNWNVQTTDIVPTIAEILNIQIPWKVTGVSVLNHEPQGRIPIRVLNAHKHIEMEFEDVEAAKLESVQFRMNRLGSELPFELPSNDWSQKWISNKMAERQIDSSGTKAQINNREAFDNVDLGSDYVPVFVSGSIYFPNGRTEHLKVGISVNGKIRAVTLSFSLNSTH
ncbi:MAG TPA: sulfatase-like hydrolase/transferase, partial [Acidobacteriota bacterium]|nr:sulfatase-like hydrolase/transferase [Acidobacteriota bacterium]